MTTIEPETTQTDNSARSLALTFFFAGAAYGLPFSLFPAAYPLNGPVSPEILNLYALTAWMGLAHFAYAYHGHGTLFLSGKRKGLPQYLLVLVLCGILLFFVRNWLHPQIFSMLVWSQHPRQSRGLEM